MNLIQDIEQYNTDFIFFCEPCKNNIMDDGTFIRILYTMPTFTLNSIYLLFQVNSVECEKYYNKYKYTFPINQNWIEKIKKIEEDILKLWKKDAIHQCKIYEQISQGTIKIFQPLYENETNSKVILKISGIWENNGNIGLTFKFIKLK
jgi:hypothetical protein